MNLVKSSIDIFNDKHQKIIDARCKLGLVLYEFFSLLKEMYDNKYYLAAGYSNFEEYTSDALNIKKSQAYEYLKLADRYSKDFMLEHNQVGATKLSLMANLSDEELERFIQKNDIENMSVKKVKKTLVAYRERLESPEDPIEEIRGSEVEIIEEDKNYSTIGEFIREQRMCNGYTRKDFLQLMNISDCYLSNIEAGRRLPNKKMFFDQLIVIFNLKPYEVQLMEELKDKYYSSKSKVSVEMLEYISSDEALLKLIRKVKSTNMTEDKWNSIMSIMEAI